MTDDRSSKVQASQLEVRPAEVAEAADALAILREAALWSARFGEPTWQPEEFTLEAQQVVARSGELVGGFERGSMSACMRLQVTDLEFWPDDGEGDALYIHKLAVRRSAAGKGWTGHLIDHAVRQALAIGASAVRLDTLPRDRMVTMYGDLGFSAVDDTPRRYGTRWMIRMELLL